MPANVGTMFYVGDAPWHKQGIQLSDPPDTLAAIKLAGLDWQVSKTRLYAEHTVPVEGWYGIRRNDNGKVLGVVKAGYTPLQNRDAFSLFEPLVTNKYLRYETAGALGEGEIVWILAKIRKEPFFSVHRDDDVAKYLLLSNSHDGRSAVSVKFTPVRVVCQNTLNLALEKGETTRFTHHLNLRARLDGMSVAIEDILRVYARAEKDFKAMASCFLDDRQMTAYFNLMFPVAEESDKLSQSQLSKRASNISAQNHLKALFEADRQGSFGIGRTLWSAYNAVTGHIDHPIEYKLGDNRFLKRIWFGEGEAIKARAYTQALRLLRRKAA